MKEFDKIKLFYDLSKDLTIGDIQEILNITKRKKYSPNEYLFEAGSLKKKIYFIHTGLVRVFVVNAKGEDITTMIRKESELVTSPNVILFNRPSKAFAETLESTEVFEIDYEALESILDKNPKLETNRTVVILDILKDTLEIMDSFILRSPEERYLDYIEKNPDIINRTPIKYIAHILGMTPVSLSRIRKRIADKKK